MKFVIRHGDLYWRPDRSGYTYQLCEAGLYSQEEAKRIEANRYTDTAVELTEAVSRMTPNLEILEKLLESTKATP